MATNKVDFLTNKHLTRSRGTTLDISNPVDTILTKVTLTKVSDPTLIKDTITEASATLKRKVLANLTPSEARHSVNLAVMEEAHLEVRLLDSLTIMEEVALEEALVVKEVVLGVTETITHRIPLGTAANLDF